MGTRKVEGINRKGEREEEAKFYSAVVTET